MRNPNGAAVTSFRRRGGAEPLRERENLGNRQRNAGRIELEEDLA